MRVLLDECLPQRLARELTGHDVRTAPQMGWASRRNGDLLGLAASRFDVFVTVDRNLPFQQNVSFFDIAIIVLAARDNTLPTLRPLMAKVLAALPNAVPGQVIVIGP